MANVNNIRAQSQALHPAPSGAAGRHIPASYFGQRIQDFEDNFTGGDPLGSGYLPPTSPHQGHLTMPNYVGTVPRVVHSPRQILLGLGTPEEVQFINDNWPDPWSFPLFGGVGLTGWQLGQYQQFLATYQSVVDQPQSAPSVDVVPMWNRDP